MGCREAASLGLYTIYTYYDGTLDALQVYSERWSWWCWIWWIIMWNISSCSAPLATFALSLVKRHPPLPSLNLTQPAHFVNTYVFTNIPNMSIISTHEAHVSNAWRCRRFCCLCCCCSMWASIFTASVLRSSPFRLLFLCTVKCFHNRRTATTTMPHDSRILEIHVVLVLPLF